MDLIILSLAVGMVDWLITPFASLCELIHTIWCHSVVTLQKSRPRSMDFFILIIELYYLLHSNENKSNWLKWILFFYCLKQWVADSDVQC